ncbi:MAG: hypothetical protein J6V74_02725, partial [Bacteroidales bacterium]|nr:hypothetical protein [Bacteroidales bacterium]
TIDTITFSYLKELGTDKEIERLDQIPFSYIMNTKFSHLKIFPINENILWSLYLQWCLHGTETACLPKIMTFDPEYPFFLFDRPVTCFSFDSIQEKNAFQEREKLLQKFYLERWKQNDALICRLCEKNEKHLKQVRILIFVSILLGILLFLSCIA